MADRQELAFPAWAKGGLVVADVHGHPDLFAALIELAEAEERFLVALGDLVDRGPDNAATVRQMLGLLAARRGLFIRGNHDDKLYRTLKGNPTVVDSDLAVTLEQLDAAPDGVMLKKQFSDAYRQAPFLLTLGTTLLVHGGWAPAMLRSKSFPGKLKALALYGEASQADQRKKPIRTYRWLDAVADGTTVVIGHHPISDRTVLVRYGSGGGRLVHLDCGAGKGRALAALRLEPCGALGDTCRATRSAGRVVIEPTALQPITAIAADEEIG